MTFSSPEWFLLLPAALVAGWFWKTLRLFSPLRLAIVVLATLLLVDPRWERRDRALDLWVLLDRSDSTEDLVDQGLPEWRRLLERSKPSRRDALHFHDYAAEIVEQGFDGPVFPGRTNLTRTGLALSHVAAMAGEDRAARVLVFTDGFSTEPLRDAANQLKARGIPVDFRLIRDETLDDFRVAAIELPDRAQIGEPFLFAVTVRGTLDGTVPLTLFRGDQKLIDTEVELVDGVGRVEFTDRIGRGGSFRYEATITPETDAHPGNNRAARWIEITGGPRVLLITRYADDPLAAALGAMDFAVDVEMEPRTLQPGRLTGARAVIFNNVPAHEIPQEFLDAADFFVREQAGGLMMVGGDHSFGSGGYFQSSIDPLLPVSMELKNEHRKLSVALAVVLDRSGSMAVNVAGGGMNRTKMDLANSGSADAIDLLGPMDYVTVSAADTVAHTIVPLTQLGNDKEKLKKRVRSIQSQGGGIFVYNAMKAAWDQLSKARVGTRHMILFSDAGDTEEPGDYKRLIEEMKNEGVTVSVIGLGTRADADAALLEDIAKRGDGRIFFTDRAVDIPKIFAQETVTIARSSFVDEPTGAQPTGRWSEISPKSLDWMPEIDGYNLSYLRPGATRSLVTTDEYVAPLVAHARRGLGRTAAIGFPLGGETSARVRAWDGYGDFVQTVTRWLMGLELPPGIGLRPRLDGTRLRVDLLYDPELWADEFARRAPTVRLSESGDRDAAYEVPWQRLEPGHFTLERDLDEGAVVRGAVRIGRHALPFGPLTVGSSIEWSFDPERLTELRAASAQTGGRELLDLSEAWLRPERRMETDLRLALGVALLGLVLFEALMTRTGWKPPLPALPRLRREGGRVARPKPAKRQRPAVSGPEPVTPEAVKDEVNETPAATPGDEGSDLRRSRYRRAKDRR
jgi:hypothetical protein